MKTIKFAEDFPKLQDDFFSTIRKTSKKLTMLTKYNIKTPTEEFQAILTNIYDVSLCDIPEEMITKDTNTSTKEEAIEKIKKFYPFLQDTDMVRLFWFGRIRINPYPHKGWNWCVKCGIPFRPGIGEEIYPYIHGHKPKGKCRFCLAEDEEED